MTVINAKTRFRPLRGRSCAITAQLDKTVKAKASVANCLPSGKRTLPTVGAGCNRECAVVEIVRVTGVTVAPLTATELGENEQEAPPGRPAVQASVTVPAKPFTPETFSEYVAG